MTFEFDRYDWIRSWDSFGTEASAFERDVHMLILTGLDAGLKLLTSEAQAEDNKLMQFFRTAKGEGAQRLAEDQADLWIQLSQQETFLRNMALVALMSRMTHSLHGMLRHAESWAPRNPKGYDGEDEFKKIWAEFRARFNITLGARHIQWLERYRRARNLIVHNGGEANILKPFVDMDADAGDAGMYDLSFSKKYPAFVDGSGFSAEVRVTEVLLDHAVKSSIRLVKHTAEELRKLDLAHAKRESENRRTDNDGVIQNA